MDKSKYTRYNWDDFVGDDFFQKWVNEPTGRSDQFWRKLIENHPEILEEVLKARQTLLAFQVENDEAELTDDEDFALLDKLLEENRKLKGAVFKANWKRNFLRIAATVLIILSVGLLWQRDNLFSDSTLAIKSRVEKVVKKTLLDKNQQYF